MDVRFFFFAQPPEKKKKNTNPQASRSPSLTPSTPAAQALVRWVDVGVADALAKSFLGSMTFGIAATADCSELIEVRA